MSCVVSRARLVDCCLPWFQLTLSSLVDLLLFSFGGYVMDRYGRKYCGIPATLIMGLAFACMPLAFDEATLVCVALVLGVGNAISAGLVMVIGADLAPDDRTAEFLGVYRVVTNSGSLIGPMLVGLIAHHGTLTTSAVTTGCIGFVGALWMAVTVKETLIVEGSVPFSHLPAENESEEHVVDGGSSMETLPCTVDASADFDTASCGSDHVLPLVACSAELRAVA